MKLTANHDCVIIETEITKTAFETVSSVNPAALCLADDDGNVTFAVSYKAGAGALATTGILFDKKTNDDKLFYSFLDKALPKETGKQRAYLEKTYGGILINLGKVEAQVIIAAEAYEVAIGAITGNIVTDVD